MVLHARINIEYFRKRIRQNRMGICSRLERAKHEIFLRESNPCIPTHRLMIRLQDWQIFNRIHNTARLPSDYALACVAGVCVRCVHIRVYTHPCERNSHHDPGALFAFCLYLRNFDMMNYRIWNKMMKHHRYRKRDR